MPYYRVHVYHSDSLSDLPLSYFCQTSLMTKLSLAAIMLTMAGSAMYYLSKHAVPVGIPPSLLHRGSRPVRADSGSPLTTDADAPPGPTAPAEAHQVDKPLVAQYPLTQLRSIDAGLREFILANQIRDAHSPGIYTPRIYDFDMTESIPGLDREPVTIALGPVMTTVYDATVHRIEGDESKIVKYLCDCAGREWIHPLLRDEYFSNKMHALGLAPKVHYVSPARKLTFSRPTSKTRFRMHIVKASACARESRSSVRFMVRDAVPQTVSDLAARYASMDHIQRIPIHLAMSIASKTIRGLERMHDAGIIHGEIHAGSVVLMAESAGTFDVGFFDFGEAKTAEEMMTRPIQGGEEEGMRYADWLYIPYTPRGVDYAKLQTPPPADSEGLRYLNSYMSPFELQGFEPSFRDDVFRAVQMAAFLINGPTYKAFVESLPWKFTEGSHLAFKAGEFLFNSIDGPDVIEAIPGITAAAKGEIRERLQAVLDLVRNVEGVATRPPYSAILAEIDAIIALAQ